MNLLIVGDSFACTELSGAYGWPFLLALKHNVTNLAKPGVGEFKILKQFASVDPEDYDLTIISHTSPYRIHTEHNPLYPDDHIYHNSDIIFADVESKQHPELNYYFKHVFDKEYYTFVHNSCIRSIEDHAWGASILHITHFDWNDDLYTLPGMINFHKLWMKNRGEYNHYNKKANQEIANTLDKKIQESKITL